MLSRQFYFSSKLLMLLSNRINGNLKGLYVKYGVYIKTEIKLSVIHTKATTSSQGGGIGGRGDDLGDRKGIPCHSISIACIASSSGRDKLPGYERGVLGAATWRKIKHLLLAFTMRHIVFQISKVDLYPSCTSLCNIVMLIRNYLKALRKTLINSFTS